MRFFDPRADAASLYAGSEFNPRLLEHVLGTLTAGWDIRTDTASLRVPMCIVHGRYDYAVPHVMWEGIVETLPGATWRLFERSGHQPFFEEPGRFADVVTHWMSGTR
jgi:proline iminopeptidase